MGMPETHWSLAVSTVDFNRDGWTDLYVANDFGPDDVYLNEGGVRFRRVAGRLFGEIGRDTYKGMNASVADFDRNGWLDVYVSNVHHSLQAEGSLPWMVGPGRDAFTPAFRDEATFRGALNERRFGWGAAAGDLDNDGWPDLVQANGMVDDRLDAARCGAGAGGGADGRLLRLGGHPAALRAGAVRGARDGTDTLVRRRHAGGDAGARPDACAASAAGRRSIAGTRSRRRSARGCWR